MTLADEFPEALKVWSNLFKRNELLTDVPLYFSNSNTSGLIPKAFFKKESFLE